MQAKRHSVVAGNITAQVVMTSVSQPPVEAAPTPQSYAQLRGLGHGQIHSHGQSSFGDGISHGGRGQGQTTDAAQDELRLLSDQQAMNFSQVSICVYDLSFLHG